MKCVVFVPGTMGSILSTPQGEEVWPPKPSEVIFGYNRKDKLLRDDLVVGDIVREVSCFDVYKPMIATLAAIGFKETGSGDRLHIFAYDWRRDLELLADRLAARIEAVAATGPTSITIVAHSMGGLVSRLVLESGKFSGKPWFAKINGLMTLGTPHLGAPLALVRILGLDGDMGISPADFKAIAADRRYPSGYQLLPAPGESACWDIKAGGTLGVLDIYNHAVAGALGMDKVLVERARWVHDTLGNGAVPAHIRYFYFAGTGHETATRVNVASTSKVITRQKDAGDGTVPLWSALPKSGQKQLVVGEHTKFFTETNFKAVFFRLFGKSFPAPPTALTAANATLSVQALTLRKTDTVELLIIPGAPSDKIKGNVILERTDRPEKPFAKVGKAIKVAYSGPPTPSLKLNLPPIGKPGAYRIRFEGEPAAASPVMFAVTDQ
jgi:pimeloyl-ACP methyl ester carboxylesterase